MVNKHIGPRVAVVAALALLILSFWSYTNRHSDATAYDQNQGHPVDIASPMSATEVRSNVQVFGDIQTTQDLLPPNVYDDFVNPGSGILYDLDKTRFLVDGEDYGFYALTTADGRLCVLGFAPRNDYPDSEPSNQSATTCRSFHEFEEMGIVLTLGPTQRQHGVVLVPDKVTGLDIQGMSLTAQATNAYEILPFDGRNIENVDAGSRVEVAAVSEDGSSKTLFQLDPGMELLPASE